MEEQQRRGAGAVRGKEIEPCPRRIAIGQIEMIRRAGAERLAAAYPIGEVSLAIGHGGGVVVGGVESLPIHRAVNDHAVPRRYSYWYIARPFGSLHAPQEEAGCRDAWMASQIRCDVAGMSRCVML
jgi:hypothetical protein